MSLPLILLYWSIVVLSSLLGGVLFWRYRLQSGVRYFLLFLLFQVGWVLALFGTYDFVGEWPGWSVVCVKLAYAFGLLMVPAVGRFFVVFPKVNESLDGWFSFLLLPLSFVVAGVVVLSDLVHAGQIFEDGVYVADRLGPFYVYYLWFVAGQFLLALFVIFKQLRFVKGVMRKRAMVSGVGALLFLGLAFLFNVILPLFDVYVSIIWLTVSFSFLFVVPTCYAIRRYRLFDVSVIAFNFLRLLLMLVLVGGVAFVIAWLFSGVWVWLQIVFGMVLAVFLCPIFVKLLPAENDLLHFKMNEELRVLLVQLMFASSVEDVNRCLEKSFVDVLGFSFVEFVPDVSLPERIVVGDVFRGQVGKFGILNLGKPIVGDKLVASEVKVLDDFLRSLEVVMGYVFDDLNMQVDFLATTAHEIKTPLNIAMFQLEDVMSAHRNNRKLVEDVGILTNTLNNLRDLTRRLLDFKKYDLRNLSLGKSEVSLQEFLGEIYKDFQFLMEREGKVFSFVCEKDVLLEIDVEQMRQVLINVLGNAMKFAEVIELTASVGKRVVIAVDDNGCGVADDLKEKVFEKFVSGSGMEPEIYGLGMGLFIAKKIVAAHGGYIEICDSELGGARVEITL